MLVANEGDLTGAVEVDKHSKALEEGDEVIFVELVIDGGAIADADQVHLEDGLPVRHVDPLR